jgi:hypothetical protein
VPWPATLTLSGNGNVGPVPFEDTTVDGVVLVLTNDSVRMRNCGSHSLSEAVTFACRGDARDDIAAGGFSYTATVG